MFPARCPACLTSCHGRSCSPAFLPTPECCIGLARAQVLPEAPPELVAELSRRYVLLYERITGEPFQVPDPAADPAARIAANVAAALEKL